MSVRIIKYFETLGKEIFADVQFWQPNNSSYLKSQEAINFFKLWSYGNMLFEDDKNIFILPLIFQGAQMLEELLSNQYAHLFYPSPFIYTQ